MRLIPFLLICLAIAAPVSAKPPLREVKEIDDTLMQIAIADEIRKTCSDINARIVRGWTQINQLESRARSLGYSAQEIDAYVSSKSEKRRMRQKAEAWLAAQGVDAADRKALCAFGARQMARKTYIGSLLR